jgi:hypothetical protein
MSDFSLQYEGVIVPPAVEAMGPVAIIAHVKAAANAPTAPAVLAFLDADLAQHARRYPARAASEQAAYAKAKAAAPQSQPAAGPGAPAIPPAPKES